MQRNKSQSFQAGPRGEHRQGRGSSLHFLYVFSTDSYSRIPLAFLFKLGKNDIHMAHKNRDEVEPGKSGNEQIFVHICTQLARSNLEQISIHVRLDNEQTKSREKVLVNKKGISFSEIWIHTSYPLVLVRSRSLWCQGPWGGTENNCTGGKWFLGAAFGWKVATKNDYWCERGPVSTCWHRQSTIKSSFDWGIEFGVLCESKGIIHKAVEVKYGWKREGRATLGKLERPR